MSKLRVTVWSEGIDGNRQPNAAKSYPNDINTEVAKFLNEDPEIEAVCRDISMPENGLSQEVIDNTDVLVYWSHLFHDQFADEVAERVVTAVLQRGMGLMLLHSAAGSKPARMLLGRNGAGGKFRECGERERIWLVNRAHPIVEGLEEDWIDIPNSEVYGEPMGIPTPDDLIFISWYQGGEVQRSGMTWNKGAGRVFYFTPGHEEFPTYSTCKPLQRVITNACKWLKPTRGPIPIGRREVDSLEKLDDVPFPERLVRSKGRINARPAPGEYNLPKVLPNKE